MHNLAADVKIVVMLLVLANTERGTPLPQAIL